MFRNWFNKWKISYEDIEFGKDYEILLEFLRLI